MLDFSGKKSKIEKQDKTLPDIDIKFKVHPIIQAYSMSAYPESKDALKFINEKIESEYALDKNSNVCLFEIGGREINDSRLKFENIVNSFQQIQKSYQMLFKDETNFKAKLRQCRDQNRLANSNNYEKDYIIDFGYKYEDPTKIYSLVPLNGRPNDEERESAKVSVKANKQGEIPLKIKPYKYDK